MTITVIPHEAHAGFAQDQTEYDIKNASITGYVTWCEDCDWSEHFPAREHPNVLWAWHEAARARDIHHDTHDKEIA